MAGDLFFKIACVIVCGFRGGGCCVWCTFRTMEEINVYFCQRDCPNFNVVVIVVGSPASNVKTEFRIEGLRLSSPDGLDIVIRAMLLQVRNHLHVEQELLVQPDQRQTLVDKPLANRHLVIHPHVSVPFPSAKLAKI